MSASPAAPGGLQWSGPGGRIEPDQVAVFNRTGRPNSPEYADRLKLCPVGLRRRLGGQVNRALDGSDLLSHFRSLRAAGANVAECLLLVLRYLRLRRRRRLCGYALLAALADSDRS